MNVSNGEEPSLSEWASYSKRGYPRHWCAHQSRCCPKVVSALTMWLSPKIDSSVGETRAGSRSADRFRAAPNRVRQAGAGRPMTAGRTANGDRAGTEAARRLHVTAPIPGTVGKSRFSRAGWAARWTKNVSGPIQGVTDGLVVEEAGIRAHGGRVLRHTPRPQSGRSGHGSAGSRRNPGVFSAPRSLAATRSL